MQNFDPTYGVTVLAVVGILGIVGITAMLVTTKGKVFEKTMDGIQAIIKKLMN